MATKLKEKIIKLSRSEKIEEILIIYIVLEAIILLTLHIFSIEIKPVLIIIMAITSLLLATICEALETLREKQEDIIRKNKLIHIIFSDEIAMSYYITWYIYLPILLITWRSERVGLITFVLVVSIPTIIILKISEIITEHFKKKLQK